jgi:hypothetical protein
MDAPQNVADYPPMQGQEYDWHDGRYRIWTVNEVPYDRFPRYGKGGPAIVALDDYSTSVSVPCYLFGVRPANADDRVTLNLRRITGRSATGLPEMEPHELNGTKYDTTEDADRAAYEAGCTAYMVYVKDEAKYGL